LPLPEGGDRGEHRNPHGDIMLVSCFGRHVT
jgi:hypothetical protein